MSFLKKRQVMHMNLSDLTYIDRKIIREGDKGFIVKAQEDEISHFWKGGPGWKGPGIRYLGCKGHALVSWIKGSDEKVEGTVKEFLEFVWDKAGYAKLPPEVRDIVENKIGVIVTVEPDIFADKTAKYIIDGVQAEAMLSDLSTKNLEGLGMTEEKKPWQQSLGEKIPWMALGGLILYLAMHNNLIR